MKEYFSKLAFSDTQLNALKRIYDTHFSMCLPDSGAVSGSVALWGEGVKFPEDPEARIARYGRTPGFVFDTAHKDPLWDEFADLLPYMASSAGLTTMPPGAVFPIHLDRKKRPHCIYFPISGCTPSGQSAYYEVDTSKSPPNPGYGHPLKDGMVIKRTLGRFAISDNAYLMNVHEWHNVVNYSNQRRIAFGWNFKSTDMSYQDCYDVLEHLGYIADNDTLKTNQKLEVSYDYAK